MKIVLVSKSSLDIGQYVEFKMSVLISPSKSLISSRWVTYMHSTKKVISYILIDNSQSFKIFILFLNIPCFRIIINKLSFIVTKIDLILTVSSRVKSHTV